MKKVFLIAMLAVAVSGCSTLKNQRAVVLKPVIGLNEDEFKLGYPYAKLIFLTNDSTTYSINTANNAVYWADDVYHFYHGKLSKFEQKKHFFNSSTVKIEEVKK